MEKNQEKVKDISVRKEKFLEQFFLLDEPIEDSIKEMQGHAIEISEVLSSEIVEMFRELFCSSEEAHEYCTDHHKSFLKKYKSVLNFRCEEVAKYLHDNKVFNLNFDEPDEAEELQQQRDDFDENEDKKLDEEILRLINKKQDCMVLKQKLQEAELLNEAMGNLLKG